MSVFNGHRQAHHKGERSAQSEPLSRTHLRHIVTVWGFLVLAVISGTFTLVAYRQNSSEAKKRYETLLAVDAAGGDVEKALRDLRGYIYAHMNTTIGSPTGVRPPIQLKGTYDRLVAAEKSRVASAKEANANLYNTAQHECEKLYPTGNSAPFRVPCFTEYVLTHKQTTDEKTIPDAMYKYDFVSPAWSPDAAGIGIVVTILLLGTFIFRVVTFMRVRHHLHMAS